MIDWTVYEQLEFHLRLFLWTSSRVWPGTVRLTHLKITYKYFNLLSGQEFRGQSINVTVSTNSESLTDTFGFLLELIRQRLSSLTVKFSDTHMLYFIVICHFHFHSDTSITEDQHWVMGPGSQSLSSNWEIPALCFDTNHLCYCFVKTLLLCDATLFKKPMELLGKFCSRCVPEHRVTAVTLAQRHCHVETGKRRAQTVAMCSLLVHREFPTST